MLGELRRHSDAIVANEQLVGRFRDAADPQLREQVARALVNTGVMLTRLGQPAEALAIYDDALTKCGDAPLKAARTLVNKAAVLGDMGRSEDALAAAT